METLTSRLTRKAAHNSGVSNMETLTSRLTRKAAHNSTVSGNFMTDNSKRHKIISLTLFSYCAFVIFLGDFIPVEFVSSTFKNIYYVTIYIGFPVFLIWAIISFFKIKRSAIFIAVSTIISVLILLIVGFAHTMCGTTTEVIFKNKNDAGTIVRRKYGCGAWDSDSPVYTYHKVVPLTPLFNIVTRFDITNIDKGIWTENNGNQPTGDFYEKAALAKAAADKAAADKAQQNKTTANS